MRLKARRAADLSVRELPENSPHRRDRPDLPTTRAPRPPQLTNHALQQLPIFSLTATAQRYINANHLHTP